MCGETKGRAYADHIVPVSEGGEIWDMGNLQRLFGPCHGRKTGDRMVTGGI